jgi:hypothetical protein
VKEVPSLIDDSNVALHDYEVRYSEGRVPFSSAATETHLVRQSKSLKNALVSFARAVPGHGPIKSIRKVVPK